jgi:hypothetical protein
MSPDGRFLPSEDDFYTKIESDLHIPLRSTHIIEMRCSNLFTRGVISHFLVASSLCVEYQEVSLVSLLSEAFSLLFSRLAWLELTYLSSIPATIMSINRPIQRQEGRIALPTCVKDEERLQSFPDNVEKVLSLPRHDNVAGQSRNLALRNDIESNQACCKM